MSELNMVLVTLLVFVLSNNFASSMEMFNFNSQNKYKIILERMEVPWKNDRILSEGKAKSFKYNRTVIGFDVEFTLNVDVNTWRCHWVFHKYSATEYKRTAIQSSINFCDALKYNYFDIGALAKLNGNFTDCPLLKGKYVVRNATIEGGRYPPNVPEGRGMVNITGFLNGKAAYIWTIYTEVKYFLSPSKH